MLQKCERRGVLGRGCGQLVRGPVVTTVFQLNSDYTRHACRAGPTRRRGGDMQHDIRDSRSRTIVAQGRGNAPRQEPVNRAGKCAHIRGDDVGPKCPLADGAQKDTPHCVMPAGGRITEPGTGTHAVVRSVCSPTKSARAGRARL